MSRPGLFLMLVVASSTCHAADTPVSFRRHVAPILVAKCLGCHGEKRAASGLKLTTFAALKRGGKAAGEAILEPGDPEASGLIESIGPGGSPRMPYKLPPLTAAEIRTLTSWVAQGARFDGPSETATPIAALVDPFKGLPRVPLTTAARDPVSSLAFSPDGTTLAVAVGGTVALVDPKTGKPVRAFAPHPGPVTAVRYSPDGTKLIAAGGRPGLFGAVTVWDATSGSQLGAGFGHVDSVLDGAISPDGRSLLTAGYDRDVRLWDLASVQPVRVLKDHTDAVLAVAFAPDGRTAASASADRTVKLWDVASGTKIRTLSDATGELNAVAFARDGKTVYAAGADRSIRAWRLDGRDAGLVQSVFAHNAPVLRLFLTPDGKGLVSSGEDRAVKLWDLATLRPRTAFPDQPDWPHALSVAAEGSRLAVGRQDGSVGIYQTTTGQLLLAFHARDATPPPTPPRPVLVRNPSLNPPSPRGAARGETVRVTLTGEAVGTSRDLVLPGPWLYATIVPAAKVDPNRLEVDLSIASDAPVGVHRIGVVTTQGVPPSQLFAVEAHPVSREAEPNEEPKSATPVSLPATLAGAIDRPGDVDFFRFPASAGRTLVFAVRSKALGSLLSAVVTLRDERGAELARSRAYEGTGDPVLACIVPRAGTYTLRVEDADFEGSGNHFYRISAGFDPYVVDVFPLGVAPGHASDHRVRGSNLGGRTEVRLTVADDAVPGSLREVPVGDSPASPPVNRRFAVVARGLQSVEAEPNDGATTAGALPVPGGVSGRIARAGDLDHYRFHARKGERLILEVFGRRLGAPIDPYLEVLDAKGQAVPRAVLRPVAETEVALRDHNSSGPGIRLTRWNNLAVNDTVLFGREVTRIFELPRNPDDDCQFWSEQGTRVGLLETTPEHHPMGQAISKVEVHPPGTTFPPGGVAPVSVFYRNDDGGPEYGKDPRVTFDPPADGDYVVRVGDARGLGDESCAYHLVVRGASPDYSASVSPEDPNVPRGGTALVTVRIQRRDGFDAPVVVTAVDLPQGVSATPALVERGATTAALALTAEASAPAFSPPTWKLVARPSGPSPGNDLRHEIDPGGANGGRITVTPEPNLKVTARPQRVLIRPGAEVSLTLTVHRGPAFAGRVPIDVRNLPHGVRVLDVGLNGVLVTEKQRERTVRLYCEPWVDARERPFYAVGKTESAGTEDSSLPITLVVESRSESVRAARSAGDTATGADR